MFGVSSWGVTANEARRIHTSRIVAMKSSRVTRPLPCRSMCLKTSSTLIPPLSCNASASCNSETVRPEPPRLDSKLSRVVNRTRSACIPLHANFTGAFASVEAPDPITLTAHRKRLSFVCSLKKCFDEGGLSFGSAARSGGGGGDGRPSCRRVVGTRSRERVLLVAIWAVVKVQSFLRRGHGDASAFHPVHSRWWAERVPRTARAARVQFEPVRGRLPRGAVGSVLLVPSSLQSQGYSYAHPLCARATGIRGAAVPCARAVGALRGLMHANASSATGARG